MSYEVEKLLKHGKKFYRMAYDQQTTDYDKTKTNASGYNGTGESQLPKFTLKEVTQDSFMRELMPQSHKVNNVAHRPNTPITKSGLPLDRKTIKSDDILDWKQRARVSISKQNTIAEKQQTHLIGNDLDLDMIEGDESAFKTFMNYWKYFKIHHGISRTVKSALTTGDGALYFYTDKLGNIKYDVWSYKYGNTVSHHPETKDRKECITRHYVYTNDDQKEIETVEVYDDTRIWTYEKQEGEWKQIKAESHGFPVIPVAYNKLDDVAWGMVQTLIESIEDSLSDLRESNEYFQFQILFLKGGKVEVLPNASKQGKVLRGDKDSDAKTLEPQSKPESFLTEVNALTEETHVGSGVVVIDPEILKGDTSGAYVKSVYFSATSYALNQIPLWTDFLSQCVEIFKYACGKVVTKNTTFAELKVSWDLQPFIPQNDYEQAQINQLAVQSRSRSKRTGSQVIKNNAPDEYARIQEEEQEEYNRSFNNPIGQNQ